MTLYRELVFFRKVVHHLVGYKHQSTDDIYRISSGVGSWNMEAITRLCDILYDQGYLLKDQRGYWILGPRSYIELRLHIENSIRAIYTLENDAEQIELDRNLENLPQILFY